MSALMPYARAFFAGGLLCVAGQLLIDYTRLTPARILTSYVVAGVVLGSLLSPRDTTPDADRVAAVLAARGAA